MDIKQIIVTTQLVSIVSTYNIDPHLFQDSSKSVTLKIYLTKIVNKCGIGSMYLVKINSLSSSNLSKFTIDLQVHQIEF